MIKALHGCTTELKRKYQMQSSGEEYEAEECETFGFFVAKDFIVGYIPCSHIGLTGLKTPISAETEQLAFEIIIDADSLEIIEQYSKF
jgi:hypothetical protein